MGRPDDSIRYRVDLEALQRFIDRLAAFDRAAEKHAAQVDKRVGDLHTTWTGVDAGVQAAFHRDWLDGVAQMRKAEEKLEENASKALGNYRGVGEHNRGMWP
jgi:hypothetical protein